MSGLSPAEREVLVETSDHAPWQYTEFGVLCSCGLPITDADRDYCQTLINLEAVVEQIIAARLAEQHKAMCEYSLIEERAGMPCTYAGVTYAANPTDPASRAGRPSGPP